MKTAHLRTALVASTILFHAAAIAQSGGDFAVSNVVIGQPGESRATGGDFAVTGTVVLSGDSTASGGDFAVEGGVTTIIHSVDAPAVRITFLANGSVRISWPAAPAGWVLQRSDVVSDQPGAADWREVTSPAVVVIGDQNTVTFGPVASRGFFRLRSP